MLNTAWLLQLYEFHYSIASIEEIVTRMWRFLYSIVVVPCQ